MKPLVPVRPALAGGTTDDVTEYPVWVERKYDGIRLMLHKSTDERGSVLCGAYTRGRGDWLEMIAGLDMSIKLLAAPNAIIDGELYGTTFDLDVVRPATVYEVYSAIQSQPIRPVTLKYAAFDLLYLNGQDLTGLPLSERRKTLSTLLAPMSMMAGSMPIAMTLAEGQLAANKEDLNRLYHHFRAQGYEGIITKDLTRPYSLAARDPSWRKRKPEITLDLVLLGATYSVTTKETSGLFGSYVTDDRSPDRTSECIRNSAGHRIATGDRRDDQIRRNRP
jgi:DNA ligase-1